MEIQEIKNRFWLPLFSSSTETERRMWKRVERRENEKKDAQTENFINEQNFIFDFFFNSPTFLFILFCFSFRFSAR